MPIYQRKVRKGSIMSNGFVMITGASSGIGKAFAAQFAKKGYDLILVARRKERLQELAEEWTKKGRKCFVLTADLAKKKECRKIMEEVRKLPVKVFINNAGFGDCGSFLETDLSKEMEMIHVNIRAMHFLMKQMLCQMEKQGEGSILNVASSAGLFPAGPYMATYYATKSYVTSLTRAVALELKEKKSNVYVGALCPGPVDTEFNKVANVEFAIPSITPTYCASYAIRKMEKRKIVIVPKNKMKVLAFISRVLPQSLVIRMTAWQQKKKRNW